MESNLKILLLLSLSVTAFMTGLIWFVQVVHYPGFQKISSQSFVSYHHFHTSATGMVVIAPMLLELALAAVMVYLAWGQWWHWLSLGLVLAVWLLTFVWIVPVHEQLGQVFDLAAAQKLVILNLVRSLLWTGKMLVLFYLCLQKL